MKKIVSIGCGGAGMFSGIVASQLRKGKFKAIALSDEADIYCRCTTPYILTGEAKLADAIQPDSMAGDYGVKVVHEKALKIDTRKKEVHTDKGNIFEYDYLVIATGASPSKPQIKGIDGKNVYTVRTSKDAQCIQGCMVDAKSAIVIGAGVIGIEMAGALRRQGLEVGLIEYANSISSAIVDEEFSEKIVGLLGDNGVKTFFNHEVVEISDNASGEKEVIVKHDGKKKNFLADVVVVATGIKPNLEIIEGTKIKATEKGIVVDSKMQTNIPNVYACGDCCLASSAVTGEPMSSALASSAIQQSKIVGFQIAGFPIKYNGSTGAFAFQTLDKEYAGVGLTETEARKKFKWVITGRAVTTDVYKDLAIAQELEVKLIFAGPMMRLVGYEAFGKGVIASAELASFAIGLKLNILKMLKFNYIAHPSMTPWPFMNPIIMATEDAMGKIMEKVKGLFN
ncbi:MAG: FAD-dependent pyridine nucleotide-disulfide oxidoreductase [uncultured bacterium]|nr:MAG: FAD-dependent pyridine nucleotide-disulfide oxidoreductase [uncultured bacterium]